MQIWISTSSSSDYYDFKHLDSDVENYKKLYSAMQEKMNNLKNGFDGIFQDLLNNVLQLSLEDYIKCIRNSLRAPRVFLRRKHTA